MNVSAVVVTRGDVDLAPILATIPYDEVIVWDNSERAFDARIFGRYLGALEARRGNLVFFQDDDVIFTEHAALEEAWRPGILVSNMDDAWVRAGEYEDVRLVGAGSLASPSLLWDVIRRYLAAGFPIDEAFTLEVDFVVGVLAPSVRVDLGYELRREIVWRPQQLSMQEWQADLKRMFIERARTIRDGWAEVPA